MYVICTQDSVGRVVCPGMMDALFVVSFLMSHDTADTFSIPSYILTPEGDGASFRHIRGSWMGLREDH